MRIAQLVGPKLLTAHTGGQSSKIDGTLRPIGFRNHLPWAPAPSPQAAACLPAMLRAFCPGILYWDEESLSLK
jgi:hypothetical protein